MAREGGNKGRKGGEKRGQGPKGKGFDPQGIAKPGTLGAKLKGKKAKGVKR